MMPLVASTSSSFVTGLTATSFSRRLQEFKKKLFLWAARCCRFNIFFLRSLFLSSLLVSPFCNESVSNCFLRLSRIFFYFSAAKEKKKKKNPPFCFYYQKRKRRSKNPKWLTPIAARCMTQAPPLRQVFQHQKKTGMRWGRPKKKKLMVVFGGEGLHTHTRDYGHIIM